MNIPNLTKLSTKGGLVRNYIPGATILYQGEVPRSSYIIQKGYVKSFNISNDGSEQIVSFHVPGEIIPLGWTFGKTSASVYFFEAMTDSRLILMQREDLVKNIKSNPKMMESMLDYAVASYTAAMLHICALEQAKAQQKILYTLYYLTKKFSSVNSRNIADILLELTHQDIASLVGLTRETTATELNKLKKQGILSYKNKKYRVDTKLLIESIGEDSFQSLKI